MAGNGWSEKHLQGFFVPGHNLKLAWTRLCMELLHFQRPNCRYYVVHHCMAQAR